MQLSALITIVVFRKEAREQEKRRVHAREKSRRADVYGLSTSHGTTGEIGEKITR
jgi:hypothetical protein